MKNRPSLSLWPSRILAARLLTGLCWALACLALACSSNAPTTLESAAENPSAQPFAAPAAGGGQEEDPDATETNFIELACVSDADCRGEDRCMFAPEPDGGAATGADAGARIGNCKVPGQP
jgi:hypothetical protein